MKITANKNHKADVLLKPWMNEDHYIAHDKFHCLAGPRSPRDFS